MHKLNREGLTIDKQNPAQIEAKKKVKDLPLDGGTCDNIFANVYAVGIDV